ncbi:hypothetical protein J3Q64DRAFT_1700145 [Phycomyces blakesleeanus]|uniref:Uncharacterized protein n=1 Tax=Phycomyces blakesleeanus TaxID=4837 RepID=A0ABR3AUL3_PHYBL
MTIKVEQHTVKVGYSENNSNIRKTHVTIIIPISSLTIFIYFNLITVFALFSKESRFKAELLYNTCAKRSPVKVIHRKVNRPYPEYEHVSILYKSKFFMYYFLVCFSKVSLEVFPKLIIHDCGLSYPPSKNSATFDTN